MLCLEMIASGISSCMVAIGGVLWWALAAVGST